MANRDIQFLLKFVSDTRALAAAEKKLASFTQQEREAAAAALAMQKATQAQAAAQAQARAQAVASQRAQQAAAAASAAQAKQAAAAQATLSRNLTDAQSKLAGFGRTALTVGAAVASIGIGLGFAEAVQTVTEYGTAISRVQAITGELARTTAGELNPTFAAVEETVRELGATTQFTASQAAEAFGLLAQAGFTAAEGIQATAGVLDLAVVGSIDLARSADVVASALRSFGLAASDAGHVADVFAEVTVRSNADVNDLAEALKFVGPVASALGVTLEQAAAAVGVLSDSGLKAELAGTGLRTVLVGLANQTPKATKVLKAAGIETDSLRETLTGGGGLIGALKQFEGRTLSATEAVEVFGLRGGPAFLVLQRAAEKAGTLTKALEESEGRARAFAKVAADNLAGDLKLLQSAIENVVLGQGGFNAALRDGVQTITGVIQVLSGTLDPLDENAQRYRELAAQVELAADAAKVAVAAYAAFQGLQIVKAIGSAIVAFTGLTGAVAGTTTAAVGFRAAVISTGIGGLVVLAGAAAVAFASLTSEVSPADVELESVNSTLESTAKVVTRVSGQTGDLALQQLPLLRSAAEKLEGQFKALATSVQGFSNEAMALQEAGTLADVAGSERLTSLQKLKAAFLGLAFGTDAATEAARILGQENGKQVAGQRELQEQLEKTNAELGRVAAIEAQASAFAAIDGRVAGLSESISETTKVAAEFGNVAEAAFAKMAIKIGDASLGIGKAADLQRDINEALRTAGLEVEVPVELSLAREQASRNLLAVTEELRKVEALAAESSLENGAAIVAKTQVQVALAQQGLQELDATIAKRAEEREQVVGQVKLLREFEAANARAAEAEKERFELAKARAALAIGTNEEIRKLEFEVKLIGLSARERERAIAIEEALTAARAAGLVGLTEEQQKLLELREAAEELARTDVKGAVSRAVGDFADEGTNVAKGFEEAVGGSLNTLTDHFKEFAKTGKLEVRDLAQSILGEFIDLGVELAVSGVLDQIRGAFAGGTQPGVAGAAGGAGGAGGGLSTALGAVSGIAGAFGGGGGAAAAFGGIASLFFDEGGTTNGVAGATKAGIVPASVFKNARRFQHGGMATGRDTIPAMLSPDEAVVPLSRGRAIPIEGGGNRSTTIVQSFNVTTPDVAGFNKSRTQIAADMQREQRRASMRNG